MVLFFYCLTSLDMQEKSYDCTCTQRDQQGHSLNAAQYEFKKFGLVSICTTFNAWVTLPANNVCSRVFRVNGGLSSYSTLILIAAAAQDE